MAEIVIPTPEIPIPGAPSAINLPCGIKIPIPPLLPSFQIKIPLPKFPPSSKKKKGPTKPRFQRLIKAFNKLRNLCNSRKPKAKYMAGEPPPARPKPTSVPPIRKGLVPPA